MTVMRSNRIFLGIILVFGLVVRMIPILHNQIYFWFDQGLDAILVKQLVVNHDLSLVGRYSGLAGVLMGPVWTWVLAVPFVLGGGNPNATVVFFSVVGILSALAVFVFLARKINRATAMITLLAIIFAPVLVYYSRVVASPHPSAFLMVFFIWWLYELVVSGKTLFWVPLFFLVGLFFQLEVGFAVFTIPVVLVTVLAFRRWRLFFSRGFVLGVLALGVTFVPQFLFDLRHNFLISHGLGRLFSGSGSNLYGKSDPLGVRFLARAKDFGEDFMTMALYVKPVWLSAFVLVVTAWGWILAYRNKRRAEIDLFKILAVILAVFCLGFSLYPGPIWSWYRAGLPMVYLLLLTVSWGVVWKTGGFLKVVVAGIVVIFFIQGLMGANVLEVLRDRKINDNAILENQLAAIDYVYSQASGRPFSYYAYTPPVYDYIWQYNFWWYGRSRYGYLPSNWQMGVPLLGIGRQGTPPKASQGLFYTIIEPDFERPWQPEGWLKTYIKVGKVLSRKEFPGRIIVEERLTE